MERAQGAASAGVQPVGQRPSRRGRARAVGLLLGGFAWMVGNAVLPMTVAHWLLGHPSPGVRAGVQLLTAIWLVIAYRIYKAHFEKTPGGELTPRGALREGALGVLMGAGLFTLVVLIVGLAGGLDLGGMHLHMALGQLEPMLGQAVFAAVSEELVFRGIVLRHLEGMLGSGFALAATSVCFGIAHLGNPGATWYAAIAVAMQAGVLLGAAYFATRRLWMAMGIHASWNFTQAWVFSVPVAGGAVPNGLLVTNRHGPGWLTGSGFGLETSAVALGVCTLAGGLLLWSVVRRGGLVAPGRFRPFHQTKL